MIDRKSGSSQLLAARAPESIMTALRGESVRPEVTQPSALNQPMALLPTQPLPSRTQHFRLDAGEAEGQMVPYGGGGPPDPEAGYSLVAPVRDFVSRQYNSLMEAFPSRPRNAMERRVREAAALSMPSLYRSTPNSTARSQSGTASQLCHHPSGRMPHWRSKGARRRSKGASQPWDPSAPRPPPHRPFSTGRWCHCPRPLHHKRWGPRARPCRRRQSGRSETMGQPLQARHGGRSRP